MGNGKTIKVTIQTNPGEGRAVSAVQGEAAQNFEEEMGGVLGFLGAPVARVLGKIVARSTENEVGTGRTSGAYNQFTCFIEAEWDIKNADTREIILRDKARVLETAEREGHKIEFIYFNMPFNPESIAGQISASDTYVKYGTFDRMVIYHHGAQITFQGQEIPGLRGQSKYKPYKYGAVVPAFEIFEALIPFVKQGAYFWIWGCGQKYALWQAEADKYGYDLKVRVYPENEDHDYAKHIAPFIDLFTK
jgi:hypothetical protein